MKKLIILSAILTGCTSMGQSDKFSGFLYPVGYTVNTYELSIQGYNPKEESELLNKMMNTCHDKDLSVSLIKVTYVNDKLNIVFKCE